MPAWSVRFQATMTSLGVVQPDEVSLHVSPAGILSAVAGVGGLPAQSGHAGQVLITDGTTATWTPLDGGTY